MDYLYDDVFLVVPAADLDQGALLVLGFESYFDILFQSTDLFVCVIQCYFNS